MSFSCSSAPGLYGQAIGTDIHGITIHAAPVEPPAVSSSAFTRYDGTQRVYVPPLELEAHGDNKRINSRPSPESSPSPASGSPGSAGASGAGAGKQKVVTSRRATAVTVGMGLRGVSYVPSSARESKPWRATINHQGHAIDIGYYATEVEAAKAYDERARELHGSRARLNFPASGERSTMGRSTYRGISFQAKCNK